METKSKTFVRELEVSAKILNDVSSRVRNLADLVEKIKEHKGKDITDLLEVILSGAIHLNCSDIHFEPTKEDVLMRVRIDGALHEATNFERKTYSLITSRIKLLASMKLNITEKPQDGRFSVKMNTPVEIRVSSLPVEDGETLVLRILNPKSLIELEELGMREALLKTVEREIKKPNGMILVSGPTGSGKTTTLYAILNKIKRPEIKIITIEDPIEYKIEGIIQTQVDPKRGYDFSNGLRAIVRQDPDVILVGEIRDPETASIALQAALTGHLVLSTIHTNDAAGIIERLLSLGEKLMNIAPAINISIAQRLVRRICPFCTIFREPNEEELEKIISGLQRINYKVQKIEKIPAPKGCRECNFSGYRGRVGIFEAFVVDEEMEKFIIKGPSIPEVREMAIKKGMVPLYQDGLLKVIGGITTLSEVERVSKED